jgi:hypothetical protein
MAWYRVYMHLDRLNVSVYTFHVNYIEFLKVGRVLCDPKASSHLTRLMFHGVLGEVLYDVIRLLHNYVVAIKSLVEHTRRTNDKISEEGKAVVSYQQRVDETFKHDPMSRFLQDLRNYYLHYEPAEIGMTISGSGEALSYFQALTLSVKELRRWDGWSAPALQYLDSVGDNVDVVTAVEQYSEKVKSFCLWFVEAVQELYAPEREAFEAKEAVLLRRNVDAGLALSRSDGQAGTTEGEELAFHGVFEIAELRELAESPSRSSERANRCLELLGKHFDVGAELEAKIGKWYVGGARGNETAAQSD